MSTQTVPKIATASGAHLTRGTAYGVVDVPALSVAAEHIPHGTEMTFLGWGTTTNRPTFGCSCGQRVTTAAETDPTAGHGIGCAVQSGVACDCRDAYTG